MTEEEFNVTISQSKLLELYQILYNENLFGLLSEENYEVGTNLLQAKLGIEIKDLKQMGLKFSVNEHLNIVAETLGIHEKQTDFWKLVVKISYIILSIERNPFIAGDVEELKAILK